MKRYNYFKFLVILLILIFMTGCGTSNITTPSEPVINSFTADPLTITAGENSTLSWEVSDATSVSIDQGVESSLALSSSASVFPTVTTTYTLTATNAAGTVTATVTVTVSTTTYTVSFNSQDGSAVSSQMVEDGGLVSEPTVPTKTGYTFGGWYKESGCTNAWDFATDTVTADVTLYAQWTPLYVLRDIGPAGGLIFYVKADGYSNGWMYMEAAPTYTDWNNKQWGSYGTLIGGTETGIGTGQSNTTRIVVWLNTHSEINRAAQLCDDLVVGSGWGFLPNFDDWFLPSKDELNLMYTNLKVAGVGSFADHYYWSSSEYFYSTTFAWYQYFSSGYQNYIFKVYTYRVRAVRAF